MNEKELLRKSGYYTVFVLFFVSLFWFLYCIQPCNAGYTGGPASGIDVGINSRSTAQTSWQVGSSGVYVIRLGIENVTGLGTATGYMTGTNTYYPRIEWTPVLGTFNFIGTGSYPVIVQVNGVGIPSAGSVSGKINSVGGTGTTNVFTDTTLAGVGTITASFGANGLVISPAEYSAVNNATGELQSQITTATGSITNHVHTGSDGTTQVSHTNLTSKGIQTHTQIDDFIASKAATSGIASLDANSLVIQNPASGTSTPGANKTVMSDGTNKISDGWLSNAVTKLGTPTTDNISEGSTNKYYTNARVNSAVGSLSVNTLSDVNIIFNENDFVKLVGGQLVAGSSSVTVAFSEVTGSVTATQLPLISGLLGSATASQLPANPTISGMVTSSGIQIQGTTTEAIVNGNLQIKVIDSTAIQGGNISLLAHFNGAASATAFVDNSSNLNNGTATDNAQLDTTEKKFGSASLVLDQSNDFAGFADINDYTIGTQSFQIDAHIYLNNLDNNMGIITHSNGMSSDGWHIYYSGGGNNGLAFQSNPGPILIQQGNENGWAINTWYWIRVSRENNTSTVNLYRDGTLLATGSNSTNFPNYSSTLKVGTGLGGTEWFGGRIDEVKMLVNETTALTVPTNEYADPSTYVQHDTKLYAQGMDVAVFSIHTPGTVTTSASYIYCNATTTVFGLGTNTAILATPTAYSGWFDGAVRATAFNVASTEKIKENIKPIKIKPDLLDAEELAKLNYIASNKIAWIAANGGSYTTVVNETGTSSVTVVDTATMESDYNNYIELEWASDINQDVYTENIQKTYEKGFWQVFDSIVPKSWTPRDKPTLNRKGFVVETMPDVVKGDDGQSIDPMALIAYISLVQQTLKADTVFALSTLKELITTGTVTQQKIDYCNERLEVLNP